MTSLDDMINSLYTQLIDIKMNENNINYYKELIDWEQINLLVEMRMIEIFLDYYIHQKEFNQMYIKLTNKGEFFLSEFLDM